MTCQAYLADRGRHCDAPGARLYPCGWRCTAHSPAALAGRPEPGQYRYCAPRRCYCGECPSWRPQTRHTPPADTPQRAVYGSRDAHAGQRPARRSVTGAEQSQEVLFDTPD